MREQEYQNLRIVIVRENWLGCTGLSAFNASLRAGVSASSLSEGEYIPIRWRSFGMRAVGKVIRNLAVREFNRELVAEIVRRRTDLLLVFKGPFVMAEALKTIRESGTRSYCFYPDVSFEEHGPYLRQSLRMYDWVFTTKTFGLKDLHDRLGVSCASFLPHAFDVNVHRPRVPTAEDCEMYDCDVSFIGAWSPKKEAVLEYLMTRRPRLKVRIWGDRWENIKRSSIVRKAVQWKPVFGRDYAMAINCSRINLGMLLEQRPGASSGDRITSRTFHIPGSGGLMLHERTDDLLKYFVEGEECVCFGDLDELVHQTDILLNDQELRRRISEQGRLKVEISHSWDHRIRTILDHFLESAKRSM